MAGVRSSSHNRMNCLLPTRAGTTFAGIVLCLSVAASAQARHSSPPAPHFSSPAAAPQSSFRPSTPQNGNGPAVEHPGGTSSAPIERRSPNGAKASGDHLPQWMNQHKNLTPEQQQKALEKEPGFRDLPPQTQQRELERLKQLNAMTPERRQRALETNEWVEHLTPAQHNQYTSAMKQLRELPPDQRVYVARTFRGLRELSPAQRQAVLNSDRFDHLTDAQRATLNSLMQVEPLMPPPYDSGQPPQPH